MAIRYVLVRFSSNVSSFQADMARAATATKSVEKAGAELAAAQGRQKQMYNEMASAVQASEAKIAAAQQKYFGANAPRLRQMVVEEGQALQKRQVQYQQDSQKVTQDIERATQQQARALEQQAQARARLGQKINVYEMIGGAAGLYGLFKMGEAAMQFNQQMSQAASISDYTRTHLKQMSDGVLTLSTIFPQSAGDFAKALATVNQAGYQGYQAMAILRQAAIGASVGMTTVDKAADDLVRTLNGLGAGTRDAVEVNNILIASVQNGIGSYHDFGEALVQVAPLARAMHISFSDMAGAIAATTSTSLTASAAGMALNRMLFQMSKDGTTASDALVGFGKAAGLANIRTGSDVIALVGLSGAIKLIGDNTHGAADEIEKLFPNIRQARIAFALFADGGVLATQRISEFRDANALAVSAAKAMEEQTKQVAYQTKIATNQFNAAKVELGENLMPVFTNLVGVIVSVVRAWEGLPHGIQQAVIVGAAFVSTFLLLRGALGVVAPVMAELAGAATAMVGRFAAMVVGEKAVTVGAEEMAVAETEATAAGVGMTAVLGPLGLIAAAVAAAATAWAFYHKSQDGGKQLADQWKQALIDQASGADGAVAQTAMLDLAQRKVLDSLQKYGIQVIDVASSLGDYNKTTASTSALTNQFEAALGTTKQQLIALGVPAQQAEHAHQQLALALRGNKDQVDAMTTTLSRYGIVLDKDVLATLSQVVGVQADYNKASGETAGQTAAAAQAALENNRALAQTGEFADTATDSMRQLDDAGQKLNKTFKDFVDTSSIFDLATQRMKNNADSFISTQQVFTDVFQAAQQAQSDAASESAKSQNEVLTDTTQRAQDLARQASRAATDIKAAVGAASSNSSAALYGLNTALRHNTQDFQDNARTVSRAMTDQKTTAHAVKETMGDVVVTADQYFAGLQKASKQTDDWNAAMDRLQSKGASADLLDNLRKTGEKGLDTVKQLADKSPAYIDKVNAAIAKLTPSTKEAQVSFQGFADAMNDQITQEAGFETNVRALMSQGYTGLALMFAEKGKDAGKALNDAVAMAAADPKHQNKVLNAAEDNAKKAAQITATGYTAEFQNEIKAMQAALQIAGVTLGDAVGKEAGTVTVKQISDSLGSAFPPDVVQRILQPLKDELLHLGVKITDIDVVPGPTPDPVDIASSNTGRGGIAGPGTGTGGPAPGPTPAHQKTAAEKKAEQDAKDKKEVDAAKGTPGNAIISLGKLGWHWLSNADGNIASFANGMENHIAQIARAGAMRVWAEPETGGEAYIPLSSSKRGRSTAILGAVAHNFGYGLVKNDDGNVYPAGSSMVSSGAAGGQPTVVVVSLKQPQSQHTTYAFNGPIQGYSLERVQADADRKRRRAALVGRARG